MMIKKAKMKMLLFFGSNSIATYCNVFLCIIDCFYVLQR
jgi:hypothetical protein